MEEKFPINVSMLDKPFSQLHTKLASHFHWVPMWKKGDYDLGEQCRWPGNQS